MPRYLVGFTVPVTADTPAKAAAQVREYFRLDRTLKVTSANGDKINDDFWAEDETVTFVEPPFTEEN
jgi:hypothetical protein